MFRPLTRHHTQLAEYPRFVRSQRLDSGSRLRGTSSFLPNRYLGAASIVAFDPPPGPDETTGGWCADLSYASCFGFWPFSFGWLLTKYRSALWTTHCWLGHAERYGNDLATGSTKASPPLSNGDERLQGSLSPCQFGRSDLYRAQSLLHAAL